MWCFLAKSPKKPQKKKKGKKEDDFVSSHDVKVCPVFVNLVDRIGGTRGGFEFPSFVAGWVGDTMLIVVGSGSYAKGNDGGVVGVTTVNKKGVV